MGLEEVFTDTYTMEKTRDLDTQYGTLLHSEGEVRCRLLKSGYDELGAQLVERAREFGFYVAVKRGFLERFHGSIDPMLNLGYLEVVGQADNTDVISPTNKLLRYTHIIPPKPI